MLRTFFSAISIIFVAYSAFVVALYFKQPSMVYFPEKKIAETPREIGLPYEDVSFRTKDGVTISGWYVPAQNARGVVLFSHGNGGNISHRLDSIAIFNSLNLGVLIYDYRGYGSSEGIPTERGTYLDAEAAWDFLVREKGVPPDKIVLYGESLGGAVATDLATKKRTAGLIIASSFTSVPDLGKKFYPWLPVKLLSRFSYDSFSKIGWAAVPKLIIHSPEDEIVPYNHGLALYEKASPPKMFVQIRGSHNEGFLQTGRPFVDGINRFVTYVLQGQGCSSCSKGPGPCGPGGCPPRQ